MIKNSRSQGSVHAVLIVGLVVMLIGALGFIFWQNFLNNESLQKKDTRVTVDKKSVSQELKLKQASIDPLFGSSLSFSYPDSWVLEHSMSGAVPVNPDVDFSSENFTITSPSGGISVIYSVTNGSGFGGMCLEEEAGKIAVLSHETIGGFSKASFVEYIGATTTNKYVDSSGIAETLNVKNLRAGDSNCKLAYLHLINLSTDPYVMLTQAVIAVKALKNEDGTAKEFNSVDEIKSYYKTAEYNTAKDILSSTKTRD